MRYNIATLLSGFYELPLFLDYVKPTVYEMAPDLEPVQIGVIISLLGFTREHIKFDSKGNVSLANCSKELFIHIFRLHILRFFFLKRQKLRNFRLYAHGLIMKNMCLDAKQSKSIDVILYLSFFVINVTYKHKYPLKVYIGEECYLPMYFTNKPELQNTELLSIDDMYDESRFKNLISRNIDTYFSLCIPSCNLTLDNKDKWLYVHTRRGTVVIKKREGEDCSFYYREYTFEEFIFECMKNYMSIIERYQEPQKEQMQ